MSVEVQKQVNLEFSSIQIQPLVSPTKSYTLMESLITNSAERDHTALDNDSLSPSPHNNTVTYVQLAPNFKVKSEPNDGETYLTQPTYTLLQSNRLMDNKVLELHSIKDACKLTGTNFPNSGRLAVIVPSEANFPQNYMTNLKQSPNISPSFASLYSHNVYTQGIPNSVSSDSSTDLACTPQKNSYIYAKPPTSPSPYTANTERARSFNAYVKQLIEAKMDCKVPISLQPKQLVDDIMNEAKKHFPEFENCTRKRIRTFLKSCRRSKKFRQQLDDSLILRKSDHSLNVSPVLGNTSDLRHNSPNTHIMINQIQPQFVTPISISSSSHLNVAAMRSILPQVTTASYAALTPKALLLNPLSNNTTSQLAQIPIPHQITTDEGFIDGKTSPCMSEINELSTDINRKSSESDDELPANGNSSHLSDEEVSFRAATPLSSASDAMQTANTLPYIPTTAINGQHHLTQNILSSQLLRQINGAASGIHTIASLQPNLLHKGHALNYNNSEVIRKSPFDLQRKRHSPSLEESSPKKLNGDSRSSLVSQVTNLSAYSYANPLSGVFSSNLNEFPNQPNGYPKITKSEAKEIQGLIDSYRVSASFLTKAAMQLEKILQTEDSRLH